MRNMRTDGAAPSADASGAGALPRVSTVALARAALAREADDDAPDGGASFPSAAQVAAAAAARARFALRAAGEPAAPGGAGAPDAGSAGAGGARAGFVERMWPAAQAAERRTGVPAAFIVGQSALESGWGRQEPRHADGRPSHNLFGIKAGPGWRGAVVEATTTEFVDGRPIRTVERFRAYDSYEASFADWARLMTASPRYADAVRAGGSVEAFAHGLQRAGYATDPQYASKLTRTITTALSLRRFAT
jgi:flagellar protein FlgJ